MLEYDIIIYTVGLFGVGSVSTILNATEKLNSVNMKEVVLWK